MASGIEDAVRSYAPPKDYGPGLFSLGKLSKRAIRKLSNAIVNFGEMLANVKLYPYQREMAYRICYSVLSSDRAEITGLFARQSGKTELVAVTINALMVMLPILSRYIGDPRIQKFRNGLWVGIFAPSYDQAETLHSRAYARLHSEHARQILADEEIGITFDDRRQTRTILLPNGSKAVCLSAAKQAKIEGQTFHLIVSDESQDIDIVIWKKSISPMGAATAATQVKIGTCNMVRSDFYEACQRNARRDANLNRPEERNHFQYDYTVAAKYNRWYRDYIQSEIDKMGFDSDEFRMSYRLHWILERGMFIEPTLLEMLGKDYSPVTFDNKNEVVAGIDVGKADASTVVTVVQPEYGFDKNTNSSRKRILNWLELKGDDYVQQAKQIVNFLENYRVKRIMVDATGVGQAMYDMLCDAYREKIDAGELEVLEFIASVTTNSEGYQKLLQDLQNARIEYPNSERAKAYSKQRNFVMQMMNLQKRYYGAYLGAEAGDVTPYKDYCSSLMLACLACDSNDGLVEIEEEDNFLYSPHGAGLLQRGRGFSADRSAPFHRQ